MTAPPPAPVGAPNLSRLVLVRHRPPADADPLVGREVELAATTSTPRRVVEVAGVAGVGKTAFVEAVARAIAPGGGIWYVDLRGFDARMPPADPDAVLAELLHRLGLTRHDAIDDLRLLGDALEERDALLVLDNAADAEQVAQVLPQQGRVLVSSRRRLGLPDAHVQELAPLCADAALELLGAGSGDRLQREESAARRIVDLCGAVPLQLVVAAAQIEGHPDSSIDDLARRLAKVRPVDGVFSALRFAVDQLPPQEQSVFRLLALHPGPEVGPSAVAALADLDEETTAAVLERLRVEHLLLPTGAGDRLHDLVRGCAVQLLEAVTPRSEQEAARERLVGHFVAVEGSSREEMAAMVTVAATYDISDDVCRLAQQVGRRLLEDGLLIAATELLERSAQALDEEVAQAGRHDLSRAHELSGRFDDAMRVLRLDRDPESSLTLRLLGNVAFRGGHYVESLALYQRSLSAAREADDPMRIGRAMTNVANALRMLGRLDHAETWFAQALEATTAAGDHWAMGHVLCNSGLLAQTRGDLGTAWSRITGATDLARDHGWRGDLCFRLAIVAQLHLETGRLSQAEESGREALALIDETDALLFAADVLDILARIALARGEQDACRALHERSRTAGEAAQIPLQLVNADNGLGELFLATGRSKEAAPLFRRALELAEQCGAPDDTQRSRRGLMACARDASAELGLAD